MSSKAHLSTELANLIQTIGETRAREEEDKIIIAAISTLKVDLTLNPRQEDFFEVLIKLLYIETLGHDASFAHIHAINLTQSKSLKIKRLAYLLITLCIKTNSKFSILLLSSIQKDLTSTNLHHLVFCLSALPKLINNIIIEACLDNIIKLTKHPTDLVRKKALLVLQKIYQVDPSKLPTFKTILQEALDDDEPPVVFGAVIIIKQLVQQHPERYRELTDNFCQILRDVLTHKYRKEYDYHRIPAPWMQITLLKLLQVLGKNDPKASAKMYEVLEKALRRSTYNQMHISNSILIQCIRTICLIYPNQGLISEAQLFISRFFEKDNHNMKCFGINLLNVMAKADPDSIKNWQFQIIDCLESDDTTLSIAAVELLTKITNEQNSQTIIKKLIDVAKKETDKTFQIKIIKKSLILTEIHSSGPQIYIETMNHILQNFPNLIDTHSLDSYINVLIQAINSNGDYMQIILDKYQGILETTDILHLVKVAVYMVGEYADRAYRKDEEKIGNLVTQILEVGNKIEDPQTLEYIMGALIKLSSAEGFKQYQLIKDFLLKMEGNPNIEVYEVAEEMSRLAKYGRAMHDSHSLKFDSDLTFLDQYLGEQGIPLQKKPSERSGLIPLKRLIEEGSLNLKPYSMGEHKKRRDDNQQSLVQPATVALVDIQDESLLRFAGPKKWTPSGYADKPPQPKSEQQPQRYSQGPNLSKQHNQPKFTIKGPQPHQDHIQKVTVDQRKINLARNIFR